MRPTLVAEAARVDAARENLRAHCSDAKPVIAVHPGASHAFKTWPLERFASAAHNLRERFGGTTIVLVDPAGYGENADWPRETFLVKRELADLMAYISLADVFLCNDSGPMHLADALGVPVVAVFERANPQGSVRRPRAHG